MHSRMYLNPTDMKGAIGNDSPFATQKAEPSGYSDRRVAQELPHLARFLSDKDFDAAELSYAIAIKAVTQPDHKNVGIGRDGQSRIAEIFVLVGVRNTSTMLFASSSDNKNRAACESRLAALARRP